MRTAIVLTAKVTANAATPTTPITLTRHRQGREVVKWAAVVKWEAVGRWAEARWVVGRWAAVKAKGTTTETVTSETTTCKKVPIIGWVVSELSAPGVALQSPMCWEIRSYKYTPYCFNSELSGPNDNRLSPAFLLRQS